MGTECIACAQAAKWATAGGRKPCVALNLSARQFLEGSLVSVVQKALARSGLTAFQLELGFTESILMQRTERTLQVLDEFEVLA